MDGFIVFRPIVLRMSGKPTPPRKPAKRNSVKGQYAKPAKDAAPARKAA